MKRILAAAAFVALASPAIAQMPGNVPAGPPATVSACLAMLHALGPKLAAAGLPAADVANIKAQGAAIAAHCNQSKFKEAHEAHAQIAATLSAKK